MKLLGGLLAAGRSERFGAANKLHQPINGTPLIAHAANALASVGADKFVVVSNAETAALLPEMFDTIEPDSERAGLGDNVAKLARYALDNGFTHLLIHLGDMPLVPAEHLSSLIAKKDGNQPVATQLEERLQVPACFPRSWFAELARLSGDRGAGPLLAQADCVTVTLDPALAEDIDTVSDLDAVKERISRSLHR